MALNINILRFHATGTSGEPLNIKGINWFGFETSSAMMDGLWQGPSAITQNFQAEVWRIKLMGFNTVRLPFSFQVGPSASDFHWMQCTGCLHGPPKGLHRCPKASFCSRFKGCLPNEALQV